jgi:hypothetical protein
MYGRFWKRAKLVGGMAHATLPAAEVVAWHCGIARTGLYSANESGMIHGQNSKKNNK